MNDTMRQTANIMAPALENVMQRKLNPDQLEPFYHDEFVTSQIAPFNEMLSGRGTASDVIVDIGGGIGLFGTALQQLLP